MLIQLLQCLVPCVYYYTIKLPIVSRCYSMLREIPYDTSQRF
jgi:hypothetical protein